MKLLGMAIVFLASLSIAQQAAQLTQVPPKPTCNPANIFNGRDCQDRINLYNQALQQRTREELQQYVNRQKDLASAPLQEQIADLNKLVADQQEQIKKLGQQIQAEATADQQQTEANATTALQAKSDAHKQGLQTGGALGAGMMAALLALFFGTRKLAHNFTVTKKPQSRAASA